MRLKKLMIVGFKSFADKTILYFDEGVTCIVGPNGCGKSNIADAFRWVLGEQSAKSMRGNKMPDVIFAGTDKRKPVNFAEVAITLTDIQGALPIDYDEITVSRRLHRSGESEYFLNGNLVRLKDIQSLFLDSGMGRHAFSIFEQGKLDQVIQNTPLERRYIFEEAAGIVRFLQRKHEALKRLEQADFNLSRVKDVYSEVEKQITQLKEQAVKAKEYKENKELLESLEKASYLMRWDALEKKWADCEELLSTRKRELEGFTKKFEEVQSLHQKTKLELQEQENGLKQKSEELYRIRGEKDILLHDSQSSKEALEEAKLKETKLRKELEEIAISHQKRQKALAEIEKEKGRIEGEFNLVGTQLTSQQEKVKKIEKEVFELRSALSAAQQKRIKLIHNESQLNGECKQLEIRLEHSRDKQGQLRLRQAQLDDEKKKLQQIVQDKKQQLNEVSALVDSHKSNLTRFEEALKRLRLDIDLKQKERDQLRRKILESKARHKVLVKMRDDFEGFSSGSKKLLQAASQSGNPFYQKIRPLYEFLQASPEISEALAGILRNYGQTLVVEKETELWQLLKYTQEMGIKDYSILCLEWLKKGSETGTFLEKISSSPVAAHFLGAVQEAADHPSALKLYHQTGEAVWSWEGAFVDNYGVLFDVKPSENQFFLREAEIKVLEEELNEGEQRLAGLEKQEEQLQQAKTSAQNERIELDKMLRKDEMKLVEVNFNLQRSLTDQEKIKGEKTNVENDIEALEQQWFEQNNALKLFQDKHRQAKQDLQSIQDEIVRFEKDLDTQAQSLRIQQQGQKQQGDLFHQLTDDKQQLLHQLNIFQLQEQDQERQKVRAAQELAAGQELQSRMAQKHANACEVLEAIEEKLKSALSLNAALDQKIGSHKETLEKLEKERSTLQEQIKNKETAIAQLVMQSAHHHSSAESLEKELEERYHLTLDEARETVVCPARSLDQIEKQIRGLRHNLQEVGNVNLASIEELENAQTRYQFLTQQVDDMTGSKQELLQIMTHLDQESRKKFKETFELIRANFHKNFRILFNGGEADLQFTETHDILEAGIEIIARPPGKQMRSMSLLSGGEKCLTAMALLFAIFEVKPAPYCILDEIDAPLDDANVGRFVQMVKHFVDRCQFIIITHNKKTMAIGDVLFGVSMEEKGVSSLLSLEFAKSTSQNSMAVILA